MPSVFGGILCSTYDTHVTSAILRPPGQHKHKQGGEGDLLQLEQRFLRDSESIRVDCIRIRVMPPIFKCWQPLPVSPGRGKDDGVAGFRGWVCGIKELRKHE